MNRKIYIPAMILMVVAMGSAQVASHAPTGGLQPHPSSFGPPTDIPVARVNGVVLTNRDLLREEYSIFPYARQHNGSVPQEMEPQIRRGAMQMIVFEELVYQEATRRKLTVPLAKLQTAEADFRQQFSTAEEYQQLLQEEFHGSRQLLREKIRRSLLIDELLKTEVENKSLVSLAEARAYYQKNIARFQYPESFAFQTISVMPPENVTPDQLKEMRKRADDALRQAQATKDSEGFGLLAEKISDDDYRVMMGDHRTVARDKLAPQVVQALLALKDGQITGVIRLDQAYTIVRLNRHILAGTYQFADVKDQIRKDLKDKKTNQLRAALDKRLRQNAKIETL
ncbi:MAG: peptidyl-prolyl cis-trans isomerase [Candidatus Sulfotelmatobacter sp.]